MIDYDPLPHSVHSRTASSALLKEGYRTGRPVMPNLCSNVWANVGPADGAEPLAGMVRITAADSEIQTPVRGKEQLIGAPRGHRPE
jgi:hypothetical protein